MPGQLQLADVIQASNAVGLLLGFAERGQEQRRQNRYDSDYHQQLDKREASMPRCHAALGPAPKWQCSPTRGVLGVPVDEFAFSHLGSVPNQSV